jgi:hypothetical protein
MCSTRSTSVTPCSQSVIIEPAASKSYSRLRPNPDRAVGTQQLRINGTASPNEHVQQLEEQLIELQGFSVSSCLTVGPRSQHKAA